MPETNERRRPRNLLVAAALAVGCSLLPGLSAGQDSIDGTSNQDVHHRRIELTLVAGPGEPPDAAWAEGVSATDFAVSLGGVEQRVLGAVPAGQADSPLWRLVVYVDPVLAGSGIADAASLLAQRAGILSRLGETEIVVAEPIADRWLESTRDLEQISEVLDWVREELSAPSPADSQTLDARLHELLSWVASSAGPGPKCLIVPIGPDTDLQASQHFGSGTSGPTIPQLLAVLGWNVIAVMPDSEVASEAGSALTQATGGSVVSNGPGLSRALEELARSLRLRVELTGGSQPSVLPLQVTLRNDPEAVRTQTWAAVRTPEAIVRSRSQRLLDEGETSGGSLSVLGQLYIGRSGGSAPGTLEVLLDVSGIKARGNLDFDISLFAQTTGGGDRYARRAIQPGDLTRSDAWLYRFPVVDPQAVDSAVVLVEERSSTRWGAALIEISDEPFEIGEETRISEAPGIEKAGRSRSAATGSQTTNIIRILPPHKRPVSGTTRIQTLTTNSMIRRVDFLLDGEKVHVDERAPFSATLDLGQNPRHRVVEVVAFGSGDHVIGRDSLVLNSDETPFQIRIRGMQGNPESGEVEILSEVKVPFDARLERVEFYWNEQLSATLTEGPYRARISSPAPGPTDYVRVVAILADGSSTEDARLLDEQLAVERVDVNLVELHVVVSDRDGRPVRGLGIDDFKVLQRGQARPVEQLTLADQVPLLLGVVIDTSKSMWTLMPDTKKAGGQFLAETLREGDRAFLVNFDNQPRLAHPTTGDLMALLRRLGTLTADGLTALYDAVIFSLLQFEEEGGRKALVLLTDGDDYGSRYGPRKCIQYSRQLGVPVYIISLAGVQDARRGVRRLDLEGITEGTGGRVFYISQMADLTDAYARINDELRSQYLLTFSTDSALSAQDLEKIEVRVKGKGRSVRTVVGGQTSG